MSPTSPPPARGRDPLDDLLLGASPVMLELKRTLRRCARSSLPALLEGETGTGKEVVARAVHELSGRRGRFVPVNVAALQEQLADAELFGAEKGAYTGAHERRCGLVEASDDGTLFLDEASDLPGWLQAKLLRALEDGCVRRLGARETTSVDFRLVVATQAPPEDLLDDHRWRSDFYFRVAGVRLRLPPLRERLDDVPALAGRFLLEFGGVVWDEACVAELSRYDWPGNVRQLRRVVNRAMTFTESASPTLEDVQRALLDEDALRQVLAMQREERNVPAPHRDPAAIARAIAVEGTYERAARRLGISLRTLHRRVKAFGLRGSPRIA